MARREEGMVVDGKPRGPLLVIGPGVLGTYLGKLWLEMGHQEGEESGVVGQSRTESSHERLRSIGFTCRTNEHATGSFPWVVFCAPINKVEDVQEEFKRALALWDGRGSFVYTSSIGVYGPGEKCDERSSLLPLGSSERVDRMLMAERTVLEGGGNVVRLAGLYHAGRGLHTAFARMGSVNRPGDHTVNLIHYEDAASLTLQVLLGTGSEEGRGYRGEVFLATDGNPVTFKSVMDAYVAGGACSTTVEFLGTGGAADSKALDDSRTRRMLGGAWSPKYSSCAEFLASGEKDWYATCGLF